MTRQIKDEKESYSLIVMAENFYVFSFCAEAVMKLKKEMGEFQTQRDEELQRLNEYKTQETKKLKHDRKLFEAWQKQQQAAANKKEKQEMEGIHYNKS